jgi:uncharacterized metal-binding protein YceD (DUF177 family)
LRQNVGDVRSDERCEGTTDPQGAVAQGVELLRHLNGNDDLEDDTEEIVVLKRSETEINVATLIYEFINLAVPYISRCDDEGNAEWCDREMIAKLEQLAPGPKEEIEDADPRWEALKNIKK